MSSDQFYFDNASGERQGPYDLPFMMRKIRLGEVTESTIIYPSKEAVTGQAAVSITSLNSLFNSAEDKQEEAAGGTVDYNLKTLLNAAWKHVQYHPGVLVSGGTFLVSMLLVLFMCQSLLGIAGTLIAFPLIFVALALYLVSMYRSNRGQPIQFSDLIRLAMAHMVPLLMAGAILTLPVMGGIALLIAPGLLVLTFTIFAPLLIVDKGMTAMGALQKSVEGVKSFGNHNLGVLFALVCMAVLGSVFLLPMAIAIHALMEIYDERFR